MFPCLRIRSRIGLLNTTTHTPQAARPLVDAALQSNWDVLLTLLKADDADASLSGGWLLAPPLHYVALLGGDDETALECGKRLLLSFPDAVHMRDFSGSLPLHKVGARRWAVPGR